MNRPIALGFVAGMSALEELRQRVALGHHDYAIMLAGGAAISRKTIDRGTGGSWRIANDIDGTLQELTDDTLWAESHIGEALDKRALLDMDGDEGLLVVEGRLVNGDEWLKDIRSRLPQQSVDPLTFTISGGPSAIKTEDDWEPAQGELVAEPCAIGPATVANIDIKVSSIVSGANAATSVELTIEDIDDLIATLTAIKQDAIEHRGFAIDAEGYWTTKEC